MNRCAGKQKHAGTFALVAAHLLAQGANCGVRFLRHVEDVRAEQGSIAVARLADLPISQWPQPTQEPEQAAFA